MYPVDPQKTYLLGFSQGAIMSMSLAHSIGDRLKGIVALNGYVPDFVKTDYPQQNVKNVSVFISHGERDPIFPIQIGEETAGYFQTLTPKFVFHTYPVGHGVSEDNQQDFIDWLYRDAGVK